MTTQQRPASRSLAAAACLVTCWLALWITACQVQPPISVGQRESKMGQGTVVILTNTSEAALSNVRVRVEGPDGEVKEHFQSTLAAKEVLEVGWLKLDGWPIPPGAKVAVQVEGYALAVKADL